MPFKNETVAKEMLHDIMMVLLETKSMTQKAAVFLNELMDKSIEYEAEKGGWESKSYADLQKEKHLWSTEKLISEFRKLFTDKTAFMNIYTTTNVVPPKFTQELQEQSDYKPLTKKKPLAHDVQRFLTN